MAENARIIVYEDPGQKLGSFCFTCATPIWGMLAPLYLITLFVDIMLNTSVQAMGNSLFFSTIFLLGLLGTAAMRDNRIVISEDGISVPILLSACNGFHNSILWEEIAAAEIQGNDLNNPASLRIKLKNKNGGAVSLSLGGMAYEDVEYLLVSLSNWLDKDALSPEIETLRSAVWHVGVSAPSYTELWEEELSSHYSATAYIPLSPGQLMQDGSIKIIKQISIGGWSAVYLVQEANTRLRVLKEAALPIGARAELKAKAEAMFGREAELLLKLDHPNVVKVHKHFEEGGRQYLLLDYINGTNLRQLIKTSGTLHRLDVIDYATGVLDILQYLHGLSPPLIHRDITPENLVVTGAGDLKLIDFGAANELLGTATGTMVGKQ